LGEGDGGVKMITMTFYVSEEAAKWLKRAAVENDRDTNIYLVFNPSKERDNSIYSVLPDNFNAPIHYVGVSIGASS
jgi:hypothetical protein